MPCLRNDANFNRSFLDIKDVKLAGKKANWKLGERFEPYGSPLTIEVPDDHSGDAEVEISLATTKECTALQWLTPEQTSNKKHPYMCMYLGQFEQHNMLTSDSLSMSGHSRPLSPSLPGHTRCEINIYLQHPLTTPCPR